MKLNIFSVYDDKAKCFFPPLFQAHIGQAIRMFCDTAQDSKTQINRHPEDFRLFHIGVFNDDDGSIESFSPTRS